MSCFGRNLVICLSVLSKLFINTISQTDITYTNSNGCENIDGGGWYLVRHVSAEYNAGHPATDNLNGNDVYNYNTDIFNFNDNIIDVQSSATWSKEFDNIEFNQYLFSWGNCEKYLIADKTSVWNGNYYSNDDRCILTSSEDYTLPYYAKWFYRGNSHIGTADPWISTKDHASCITADSNNCIVYGENSINSETRMWGFINNGGGNVWIRNKENENRYCGMSGKPTSFPSLEPSISPSNEPTYQPSLQPTRVLNINYINSNGCENIDGGGWYLVRRVSHEYNAGHPAIDNLNGNDVYNYNTDIFNFNDNIIDVQSGATWSKQFNNIEYNQYLFSWGDCEKWLVADKTSVWNGNYYSNDDRCILSSSEDYTLPYYAKWYYRGNSHTDRADPWISTKDHLSCVTADSNNCIVYGENSINTETRIWGFLNHGGGNVWIRNNQNENRYCGMTGTPTYEPSQIPSNQPTSLPSQTPSHEPTPQPSLQPTVESCEYTHKCTSWGDPHITTFDNTIYHFQGQGYFDYFKSCPITSGNSNTYNSYPFIISGHHYQCRESATCIDELIVTINDGNIVSFPSKSNPIFKDSNENAIGNYQFLDDNNNNVIYIISKYNFEIEFNYNGKISKLKFSYYNRALNIWTTDCLYGNYNICGLCGNINDNTQDDFQTCDNLEILDNTGSSYTFEGEIWENVHEFGESCCRADLDNKYYGETDCGVNPPTPDGPDPVCMNAATEICEQIYDTYCVDCQDNNNNNNSVMSDDIDSIDSFDNFDSWISSCEYDFCAINECSNGILNNEWELKDAINNGCLDTQINDCFMQKWGDVAQRIVN